MLLYFIGSRVGQAQLYNRNVKGCKLGKGLQESGIQYEKEGYKCYVLSILGIPHERLARLKQQSLLDYSSSRANSPKVRTTSTRTQLSHSSVQPRTLPP